MQPSPLRSRLNRLLWELGEQELESVDDRLPAAAKRVAALLELTFASLRQVVDEAELLLGIPDSGVRTPPATREPLRAQPELTETTPSGSHSPPAPTPDPTPYPECSTSSGPGAPRRGWGQEQTKERWGKLAEKHVEREAWLEAHKETK